MITDTKIYERPRQAIISVCLAIGCFFVGVQYISSGETRLLGIFAFLLGVIFLIVTVYVIKTPMIIISQDYIMFGTGNFAKREIAYSTIESWSLQNQDKHFSLHFKKNAQEDIDDIKEIIINYNNVRKMDRQVLIDVLSKKGIYQNQGKQIIMLDKGKDL
jgi:hypothetical protein